MTSLLRSLKQTQAATRARRWRRMLALSGSRAHDFESRLLWIFGSPRSGSTWLLNLLAEHDAVTPINEPLIGLYLGPFLCDLPGGDASRLDDLTFTLRRVQRDHAPAFFAEEFSYVWMPGLARLMLERFYEHGLRDPVAARSPQRLIAIKEPNGSQSADVLMRATPRAKLLFLLRDGRDVVDSELAANLEGSWVTREFPGLRGVTEFERLPFVVQSAYKWLWRTEVVQEAFRHHSGPKYLLRYEDLVVNTRRASACAARLAEPTSNRWRASELDRTQLLWPSRR